MAAKSRRFCFTYYWKTREDITLIQEWLTTNTKFAMFGEETCPTTGRQHLQGWMAFENERSFNAIKKKFPWHLEICNGTAAQNIQYCAKEGIVWKHGTEPAGQGARQDLATLKHMVLNTNMPTHEIMLHYCDNLQQMRYIEHLIKWMKPPNRCEDGVNVTVVHGPSGSGKTRWVHENYPDAYWKDKTKWWDGYSGEAVVVIDDYRPDFCKFHELLNLLDRYPVRIEMKGGGTWLKANTIIITSNKDLLEHWHNRTDEDLQQLRRRISASYYLGPPREQGMTIGRIGNTRTMRLTEMDPITMKDHKDVEEYFKDLQPREDGPGASP